VQERTGLLTEGCCKALTAVIRREQNIGIPSEQIVTALCDAWARLPEGIAELAVTFGAEKFLVKASGKTVNLGDGGTMELQRPKSSLKRS